MLPEGLVPKYFASEWSFAQVRGIEGKALCAFAADGRLAVVSADGSFLLAGFEDGGEAQRLVYTRFAKLATSSRGGAAAEGEGP